MPVDTIELLNAAEIVAQEKNMKVTLKYSLGAGAFTGLTTLIGGILAGPVGLFFGATIGGGVSTVATHGKFKSVVSVLREDLTERQKDQLCHHLRKALENIDITDVAGLAALVMKEEMLMLAIAGGIKKFLESDMSLQLMA